MARSDKINFTIADCEYVWDLWCKKEYEKIEEIVLTLKPLEAMKLAKQLVVCHDEDGCVVNGIIGFITNEVSRDCMIARRDGTMDEYCKKYGIDQK